MKHLLLILLFACVNQVLGQQSEAPLDLYLAFDQSGSLSERRFRQLVDFGEALSFGVSDITGFFSEEKNGLRVGAVTFGCSGQTKERLLPTGDDAEIRRKMENMRIHVNTYGETCFEDAFKFLLGYKERQEEISPPNRATALVVLSDGRFDDFDNWQDELAEFRDSLSQGFAVGIGDNVRESQMVVIADDNPDKYFHVDDPDSLSTLIELIASMVIDDFVSELIETETSAPVTDSDNCVGKSVSVKISGNSVQVYSEEMDISCDFVYPDGTIGTVEAVGVSEEGSTVLYCENPDISSKYEDFTVELRVNGNRVYSNSFIFSRTECAEIDFFFGSEEVSSFQHCPGVQQASIAFTGESASLIANKLERAECRLTYVGSDNEVSIMSGGLAFEAPEVLRCILPEELFVGDSITPDEIELAIVVVLEEYESVAFSQVVDTTLKSDCLQISVSNLNGDPEICYGDTVVVSFSGETVSNVYDSIDAGALSVLSCDVNDGVGNVGSTSMDLDSDSGVLSCRLPFDYGIFERNEIGLELRFTSSAGERSYGFSVEPFALPHCFDNGFPRKFVVQSTDEQRVLDERFCAGDGYEIEFSGVSPSNMVALSEADNLDFDLYCDFFKFGNDGSYLFRVDAVVDASGVVLCKAIVWDPFDPVTSEFFDLSEVRLVLVGNDINLDEGMMVDIYTGSSFCFDDPDHQVPDGFAPPETDDSEEARRLQEDCFPFCCQRTNVSISFSGRTVAVVGEAQAGVENSLLRCVYTTTQDTQIITDVIVEGEKASCVAAPGWELRGNSGDYSLVELELVLPSGDITKFSRFDYDPSTASFSCINNVPLDFYCLGESVVFESYGLTLLAIAADPTLSYDADLFDINLEAEELTVTVLDDDRKTIVSSWRKFDENVILTNQNLQLNADGILVHEENIAEIRIENLDRCLDVEEATSVCFATPEGEIFISNFAGAGDALTFYPISQGSYSCAFISDDQRFIQPAIIVNETITCEVSQEVAVSSFEVIYTNATDNRDILLKVGDIVPDTGCLVTQAPVTTASPTTATPTTATPTTATPTTATPTTVAPTTLEPTTLITQVPITQAPVTEPLVTPVPSIEVVDPEDSDPEDGDSNLAFILPIILIIALVALVAFLVYKRRNKDKAALLPVSKPAPVFAVGDSVEMFCPALKLSEEQRKNLISKGVNPEEGGFWFKGRVESKSTFDAISDASSLSSGDIEGGENTYFVYKVAVFDEFAEFQVPKDESDNVLWKNIIGLRSNFKKGQKVVFGAEDDTVYEVIEILPNDSYALQAVDKSERVIGKGDLIGLSTNSASKATDPITSTAENLENISTGEAIEALNSSEEHIARAADGTENLPATSVHPGHFEEHQVVQVKPSDDSHWKRATVVSLLENGHFKVLVDESSEPITISAVYIRLPVFEVNDRVEMLDETSPIWEPGIVQEVKNDKSYKVNLTRKAEVATAKASSLRFLELDEVVKRVRRGAPQRTENYDSSIPDEGENIVPKAQRFKVRKAKSYIELPNHQFEITIDPSDGLGVKFGWTKDKVIVASFNDLANGDWGALEATGLVMLQDQLLQINGEDVVGSGRSDLTRLLDEQKTSKSLVLKFGRSDEYVRSQAENKVSIA